MLEFLISPLGFVVVAGVAVVAIVAFFLLRNSLTQEVQNKIDAALHTWSQTDEKLADMSLSWLDTMFVEVEDILNFHSHSLYKETWEKLDNLADRLAFIISAEEGIQVYSEELEESNQ